MADQYPTLEALTAAEPRSNWQILVESRGHRVTVVAPHGGGIEPYTSEIAARVAGDDFNMFRFEARRPDGNQALHVSSERYSHPGLDSLLSSSAIAISIHGKEDSRPAIGIGGCNQRLATLIEKHLCRVGFDAAPETQPHLLGRSPQNFVNRAREEGVQLELMLSLRKRLSTDGILLQAFVAGVRVAIEEY